MADEVMTAEVVETPTVFNTPLALRGENGDIITPNFIDGYAIASLSGAPTVRGLHSAPRSIISTEGALNGSRYQRTRANSRVIDMSLYVAGKTPDEFRARLRRLHRLLAGKIVLTYSNEVGTVVQTVCYYQGGAEGQRGVGEGTSVYQQYVLTLWCPEPYWSSATALTQDFSVGADVTKGLLPFFGSMPLSNSQIIGTDVRVTNPGDVASYPLWQINGPFNTFTLTNTTLKKSFGFTQAMQAGQYLLVDTNAKTVVDQTGANRWPGMGEAASLFQLRPGLNVLQLSLDGATSGSGVQMSYYPLYEIAV